MASIPRHIELARSLPPQLLRFFTRFPPAQVAVAGTPGPIAPTTTQTIAAASTVSAVDPNIGAEASEEPIETQLSAPATAKKVNPFLPFRNPRTGAWHGPHYSLRRQADLYKQAQRHGVLSLMPESPKHPEIKLQRRIERGLRVQGTGEGKKVKGKLWERTLHSRQEERRKAMEAMPEMIRQWKERGHGRGWKKWPK